MGYCDDPFWYEDHAVYTEYDEDGFPYYTLSDGTYCDADGNID